ncbi:transglycosylase SLT domain-containing protein [Acinetobacter modestus]|uniref:transglycosylase SLT domain-containing protein n=1 Tax=Acinetobacter modestus TaxID=1776740 RepID=UPI003018C9A1
MATNLGTLTLNLLANIGSYVQNMQRAERQTQQSTENMSDGFDLVGKSLNVLKGAVAGLSVAGVTAYALEVVRLGNEVDRLAKLSNSSVSQFQYYGKGAETVGIQIDKFADQMKDMQDRIGDFQQTGGGPLADFFENIAPLVGVSIQQFQKLSGPEALQLFYNSLERVGATKNDIKFYMEQIISDSSQLIPLLENNGKGFKEWGDRAKETGAIMSDDVIKNLVETQKNLQIFELQWQGLKNGLVADVIPVFGFVADNLDTIKAGAFALSVVIGSRLALSFTIAGVQAAASLIEFGRYQVALARMAGETITLATVTRGLGGAMLGLVGGPVGLIALGAQVAIAGAAYYSFKKYTDESTLSLDDQGNSVDGLISKYNELSVSQKNAFSFRETKDLAQKTEDYAKAKAAFYDSAVAIAYEGAAAKDQVKIIDALVQQFKEGKISAVDFADGMQNLGIYTKEQINTAVTYAQKTMDAKVALDNQKQVVDTLSNANQKATKAQQEQTTALTENAKAWLALGQAQRQALTAMKTDMLRDQYIKNTVGNGWTKDQAEAFASYRDKAGIGFSSKDKLSELERNAVISSFNSKNYTFTAKDLAAIAKVQGIAKANNFAQIEQLYGLQAGSLAALVLQESRGNPDAVSPTGAKGLFQTTSVFRKQYNLNANSSIEAQAIAAATDLQKNFKEFGNVNQMFMAYNAGITGLKTYLEGGLSTDKRAEVGSYAGGIQKWFAGVNGKTSVDNSLVMPTQADLLESVARSAEAAKLLADKRKEVDQTYFKESEILAKDHQARIDKITEAYGGSPMFKEKLKQENELYAAQSAKLVADKQNEYNQYFAFETDRITQIERDYEYQKQLISSNTEFSKTQRAEISAALERQKQQEIAQEKLGREQRLFDASQFYMSETDLMKERYRLEREELNLIVNESERVARIRLSKQQEQLSFLDHAIQANLAWEQVQADMNGTSSLFSLDQDRKDKVGKSLAVANSQDALAKTAAEREAIWQAHTERMAMIDQDYWTRSAQMNLGYGENIVGSFADMAKSIYGEQSSTYRAMFAVQKAFSIDSSIVAITNGIALAAANPFPYNLAAMATVAASTATLVSDISSVAGFATGGHITGQGTGTSDEIPIWASNGEFMIRAAAVEKLGLANLDYINRTGMLPPRFATGGLINSDIMRTKTIGNTPSKGVDYNMMQSQQQQPTVDNNMKVLIFDDRASYEQEMMGPTGERIFLYHWKRNQSKLSR